MSGDQNIPAPKSSWLKRLGVSSPEGQDYRSLITDTVTPAVLVGAYLGFAPYLPFWGHFIFVVIFVLYTVEFFNLKAGILNLIKRSLMASRHSLVNSRKVTLSLRRAFESYNDGDGIDYRYKLGDALQCTLDGIFLAVSDNNSDLNNHYRVSFLIPNEHNVLEIIAFSNSERKMPRTMAAKKTFQMGEGTAGNAWLLGKELIVPDVRDELKKSVTNGESQLFKDFHDKHRDGKVGSIKTIWCIPVFKDTKCKAEKPDNESNVTTSLEIYGVVSIDSDKLGIFDESSIEGMMLRQRIEPFIRFIELILEAPILVPPSSNLTVDPSARPDSKESAND